LRRLSIFVPESYIEILDLFVSEEMFPNRSEAIRSAIRTLIKQQIELEKVLERHKNRPQNILNEKRKNRIKQICEEEEKIDEILDKR